MNPSTVSTLNTLGAVGVALVGVLTVVGIVWKAAKLIKRIVHFLDDWSGEPGRPGVEKRLGVLERLANVEKQARQLTPNGGSHLADAVARMEAQLTDHVCLMPETLARIDRRMDLLERTVHEQPAADAAVRLAAINVAARAVAEEPIRLAADLNVITHTVPEGTS